MEVTDLEQTAAPCGLVCGLCTHAHSAHAACPGCRNDGGDRNCHQRACSAAKGLDGCWACDGFPCDRG